MKYDRDILQSHLEELSEPLYKAFTCKLLPSVHENRIMGVRRPALRRLAKKLAKDIEMKDAFLGDLPHKYLEEDALHRYLLEGIKDLDEALEKMNTFLPYIDNWAICDMSFPKVFKSHKKLVRTQLRQWFAKGEPYYVRAVFVLLLQNFLDESFEATDLDFARQVDYGRYEGYDLYYVKMAVAWYVSMALVHHYEEVVGVLEKKSLDRWVHNKAIQKARESFQIDDHRKMYLKRLTY